MRDMKFWHMALPFIMVNAVLWGVGTMALPILAGSDTRAGYVFAMLNLGVAVGSVTWGYLADRIPISVLIFFSTVLSTIVWAAITVLNGGLLIALAFLFGLFAAAIWALATPLVTKSYPKPRWDGMIARLQQSLQGGQVLGLLVAAVRATPLAAIPFMVIGIVSSLPARLAEERAGVSLFIHQRHHVPIGRPIDILHGHSIAAFRPRHLLHLRNVPLLVFMVRWVLIMLTVAPVLAVYPLMMSGVFGIGTAAASTIFAVSTVANVLLFTPAASLSKAKSPFFVFNIGVVVCLAGFLMMWSVDWGLTRWMGVVGFLLTQASWAPVATGMNVGIARLVSPEKESETLGLANSFMSLDNMVGGLIAGVLIAAVGYKSLFILGSGLAAAAFALEFIHIPVRRRLEKAAGTARGQETGAGLR
jgi:MFS family permease